jgi:hypothetical protein
MDEFKSDSVRSYGEMCKIVKTKIRKALSSGWEITTGMYLMPPKEHPALVNSWAMTAYPFVYEGQVIYVPHWIDMYF